MTTIKAEGIRNGQHITVFCCKINKIKFLFNTIIDPDKEQDIRNLMERRFPIAGTYYPETESMLNVLNVLQYHYFDEPPEIVTEGEFEEMPYEKGVVY